ncbi:hypothetical protein LCGC14_2813050, partial [marine sediment metagenome]
MPNYDKPPMNNIPFEFTTGGYTKPDFSEVPFQWGLRPIFQQTASLQAAITVVSQSSADLPASIQGIIGWRDLGAYIKSIIQATKNLGVSVFGIAPSDLAAIINIIEIRDLPAEVEAILPVDLPASLISILLKSSVDLGGRVRVFQREYANLEVFIYTSTQLFDLSASINAAEMLNLPSFIRAFVEDTKNLRAVIDII